MTASLYGSLWTRALFAWYFGDVKLLISDNVTSTSRILFRRLIQDRIQRIAPFLRLDHDPYLVVSDGRLIWLQDAYTASDALPYSQRSRAIGINYIRNAVKIAVDAYDGDPVFYVADPTDPIVQTYQRIFPSLFRQMDSMPASLRSHIRYPEDLFILQASVYGTYHMKDPEVFYNKEDLWSLPKESHKGQTTVMQPYYTIMRLPGESREEFILMLPMVPNNRDNMIAWLAARCDGANYGKVIEFAFSKEKLIYGPAQIEARIDQDTTISQQLSLWNQMGSRVIRGNLLVIPIDDALLYVEPLYLSAESRQLPELKRLIASTGDRVVMAQNADSLFAALFVQEPKQPAVAASTPADTGARQNWGPTPRLSTITGELWMRSAKATGAPSGRKWTPCKRHYKVSQQNHPRTKILKLEQVFPSCLPDVKAEVAMFEIALWPLFFVLGVLALVLVNGVFVAAEFAIVRVRRTRLEELAGQGIEAAKNAIVLVDHVSEYLAVTQIAITAASLGVGWLGEDAFAHLLILLFPNYRAPSTVLHVAAAIVAFFFITMIQVVVGELVPKNLAIRKAERLLLFLARPLQILHIALRPFHWLFEKLSSWILRCMGHGEISHPPLTEDELKLVLMDSHEEGIISEGEAKIIIRAFEFADKQAEEIMIPAERVDFISLARTFEQNLALARKNMHTRFPLCRNGLDTVVGIVSMKDMWPLLQLENRTPSSSRCAGL